MPSVNSAANGKGKSVLNLRPAMNFTMCCAAASGVIVVATLVLMVVAERFAGLTKQLR